MAGYHAACPCRACTAAVGGLSMIWREEVSVPWPYTGKGRGAAEIIPSSPKTTTPCRTRACKYITRSTGTDRAQASTSENKTNCTAPSTGLSTICGMVKAQPGSAVSSPCSVQWSHKGLQADHRAGSKEPLPVQRQPSDTAFINTLCLSRCCFWALGR